MTPATLVERLREDIRARFLRILAGPGWGNITDRIGRRRWTVACFTGGALLLAEPLGARVLIASAAILGGIALTIVRKKA